MRKLSLLAAVLMPLLLLADTASAFNYGWPTRERIRAPVSSLPHQE
jgi:hypothetical protein